MDDKIFFDFIKKAFVEPRKKLINNLSKAGFDKDFVKNIFKQKNIDENIRQFYYAVPYYILDKIKELVPENAGILVAKIFEKTNRKGEVISKKWIIEKIKSPKNNNLAKPIDDKKLNVIFRIGYLKYWFHRKRKEKEEKQKGWWN